MAVAKLPDYSLAVECYDSLVELRHQRDVLKKDLANSWRKRNEDGNIWYSAQYRPTYTQEAVSDLSTVLDAFDTNTKVYWENQWRRGDDKYWNQQVEHIDLPKYNARDSYAMLRALGYEHYKEYEISKGKKPLTQDEAEAQVQETQAQETA